MLRLKLGGLAACVVLSLTLGGCAARGPRPGIPVVGVEQFKIYTPTGDSRERKVADDAAEKFVIALRDEGADAYLIPHGGQPTGDVRVTGLITELDFRGRRRFGVIITARDAKGRELAEESASRSSYNMRKAVRAVVTVDLLASPELRHALLTMPALP